MTSGVPGRSAAKVGEVSGLEQVRPDSATGLVGAQSGDSSDSQRSDGAGRGLLERLVAGAGALLLDFDGPCVRLFADADRPAMMAALAEAADAAGAPMPKDLREATDPMIVLDWCRDQAEAVRGAVEQRLSLLEADLLVAAAPTAGLVELWTTATRAGRAVAVVTNNSASAATGFLHRVLGAASTSVVVIGREPDRLHELKPSPVPVLRAAAALGVAPARCLLVGDSGSDMAAATASGAVGIGLVRREDKRAELLGGGASVLIEELPTLTAAFG